MGHCCSKSAAVSVANNNHDHPTPAAAVSVQQSKHPPVPPSPVAAGDVKNTPSHSFTASPFPSPLPAGVAPSPARTPGRKFRWPLPPPSPAKPIMAAFRRRREAKPKDGPIPEENNHQGGEEEGERGLDKSFGYGKNFGAKFELGKEVGRGHFGHTCSAKGKKGELKGQPVAVKIISKAKYIIKYAFSAAKRERLNVALWVMEHISSVMLHMTTAIAIEDVRREVKILKALSGHKNLVKFYDAFEDANNVYIVMELCEGGELLDKILSRGGRYTEEDAKVIVVQILSVVAYCHLQGVVHRDLKPENFLFATREEDASMRVIDFGLSDFIRPDQRLNDIVGSAYYVAPEVLHRSYSVEADMWSIGVITYILLCGSRPFWARTESGIFRSVLRADPNFNDTPWPTVSPEAKDFVKRLLNKDHRKRMTAAQALTHPWLRDERRAVPLDLVIYKSVRSYVRATPFRRAAMKALSKAITEDELYYLRAQFTLLEPKHGYVSLDNFRTALMKNSTDAMKESRVHDIINVTQPVAEYDTIEKQNYLYFICCGFCMMAYSHIFLGFYFKMEPLAHKKLDFEEFCVAAISTYQLEALEGWEKIASTAFECFEREGNRVISVEELAQEMNLGPTSYSLLRDWIRTSDRKLSFLGYTKFLHGVTIRTSNTRHR
uniref:Serine/threonine protein kinase n=1 Tax=Rosa rugosa TaxID=74645 RepID=J7G313_ROSRU|nr:serine/threonine protein kinase [Rosa rugosa]